MIVKFSDYGMDIDEKLCYGADRKNPDDVLIVGISAVRPIPELGHPCDVFLTALGDRTLPT